MLLIGVVVILMAGCGGGTNVPDSLKTIAKNGEVHILTEGMNAPFEFGKDTGFQGLGADVGEEIAKSLGYPLKWISSKGVDHLFEVLKDGTTVDMIISSVASDPQKAENFDFSVPYYDTGDVIAHHRTEFGITDLASLSGKKIGVVAGHPADSFMTSQTTASDVTLSRYSTADEALGYLNRREIDAVVGDEILLNYSSVESYPNTNILNSIINKYSYAVAVRKGDAKLLAKVNEIISDLKSSGKLSQLEAQWVGDIKERAKERASADREEEELKKGPKTISVVINKQSGSGNWNMERLDGFQFVLKGANGTYQSTPILTEGNRGDCRFAQPVPPGDYTMNIDILKITSDVHVPEYPKKALSMTVNIASAVTITFR